MHVNLAEFATGLILGANGLGVVSFTARLNRIRRLFPRPPRLETTERALILVRLALACAMVTAPTAIWTLAMTVAPAMLKPLF